MVKARAISWGNSAMKANFSVSWERVNESEASAVCPRLTGAYIMDVQEFTRAYMVCALWSSNDANDETGGNPLDDNYTPDDIAPETAETMREDCARFIRENAADLAAYAEERAGLEWSAATLAGHDFWLTRNRHGTGFWDRGLSEELGERLTAAAHAFGETWLYVGDDGKIYS